MYNPYLIVPLLVWAITQFLKFVLAALRGNVDFRYLYASGGMPSVHSAVVTSLATTAFLVDGPKSSLFGISVILAAIVMYDSFGVRRSSGEQAAAINLILDSMDKDKIPLSHPQRRLRELLGHKPLEVTIGALLGFILAGLFNASKLTQLWDFLMHPIGRRAIIALAVISALAVIAAIVCRILFLNKYRRISIIEAAIKRSANYLSLVGIVGLILAFMAYENVATARWIVWPILLLIFSIITATWLYKRYYPNIQPALVAEDAIIQKQKWLEGPNKKKRAAKERSRKRR